MILFEYELKMPAQSTKYMTKRILREYCRVWFTSVDWLLSTGTVLLKLTQGFIKEACVQPGNHCQELLTSEW